ncbi:hypothetical protein FOZ63_001102, partial [Perkinsus olseni]
MPAPLAWTLLSTLEDAPPEREDAFEEALVRLRLPFPLNNQYKRENQGVYFCADHLACSKKYKLVWEGTTVRVYQHGEHGTVPIDLDRQQHPKQITRFVFDQASLGLTASQIYNAMVSQHRYYTDTGRINRVKIQEIMSSMPRRRAAGAQPTTNYYQLEEALGDNKLNQAMVDMIKDDQELAEEYIYHRGVWGDQHFSCMVGGASMISSLYWFIRSCPSGFPLYMDAQNKIIRGGLKVAWIGTTRVWYNRRNEAHHTFVPFLMGLCDEECYETYYGLLAELDKLVKLLTNDTRQLSDVVNLCLHDAHQGAIRACEDYLPGIRNGRCYFHLSKNIKENKTRLGEAYDLVKQHKFFLHACPTDELYEMISAALIEEVQLIDDDAAAYLGNTLDVERYGYPNIALTSEGLRCAQVLNNVVEAFHRTQCRIFGSNRLRMPILGARIKQMVNSLKGSSPQHFVKRPEVINRIRYNETARIRGTSLAATDAVIDDVQQVTDMVEEILEENVSSNFFVIKSLRAPDDLDDDSAIEMFLRGVLLDDFPTDNAATLEFLMRTYFSFNLITLEAPHGDHSLSGIIQKTGDFPLYVEDVRRGVELVLWVGTTRLLQRPVQFLFLFAVTRIDAET